MDYRALLAKYMDHVAEAEGIDFVDARGPEVADLDPDEWAELERISAEAPARAEVRQQAALLACATEGHRWVAQKPYHQDTPPWWWCPRCSAKAKVDPTATAPVPGTHCPPNAKA
jgi:hypothetical protein